MIPNASSPFRVLPWEKDQFGVVMKYQSGDLIFTECIELPFEWEITTNRRLLIDILALACAVSYAKAFAPCEIDVSAYSLTAPTTQMITDLYDHGMREFAVVNNLEVENTFSLKGFKTAAINISESSPVVSIKPLIPMGGGRDSSVVAVALKSLDPVLLSIGENPYVEQIAERLSLQLHTVIRQIDEKILALNTQGALNGHIPVTAINSLIAILVADILGCTSVVMANEASASEPTRIVGGLKINHQYSKSYDFEVLLRSALASTGSNIDYFSALRNQTDNDIAVGFAHYCAELHTAFMSCNKAMLRDHTRRSSSWCGDCSKCRSVYLSLALHLSPKALIDIFGSDLLNENSQITGFKDLIDIDNKPFECVGEIASAREAFNVLRVSPYWENHEVVKAIAAVSLTNFSSSETSNKHFIPDQVQQLFRTMFSS